MRFLCLKAPSKLSKGSNTSFLSPLHGRLAVLLLQLQSICLHVATADGLDIMDTRRFFA